MGSKKDQKAVTKTVKAKVKVDLLLDALLDEANLDVEDADAIINACYALEALKLAEGSEMTTESQDGAITKHYMFIATEKLRGLLATLGMLHKSPCIFSYYFPIGCH